MSAEFLALVRVALHTFCIYLLLILGLRLIGRRQLGQLSAVDLMIILLLGSAVETAMVSGNTTLPAGLVSAATLLGTNALLTGVLSRSRRLRHLVQGGPVLLVHNGHLVEEHLRKIGFTAADVMEALRERECAELKEVRFAVMETDGRINVVPMHEKVHHLDPGTAA